ncbi:hypothetical protein NSND_61110 [Nitrospira sp. ND1]|nr:hypothetical protein NSND_61110 [Nitrospira sp. ND1]
MVLSGQQSITPFRKRSTEWLAPCTTGGRMGQESGLIQREQLGWDMRAWQ